MAWAALGGAFALKGNFLRLQDLVVKGLEMERARGRHRSRSLGRARLARHGAPVPRAGSTKR